MSVGNLAFQLIHPLCLLLGRIAFPTSCSCQGLLMLICGQASCLRQPLTINFMLSEVHTLACVKCLQYFEPAYQPEQHHMKAQVLMDGHCSVPARKH